MESSTLPTGNEILIKGMRAAHNMDPGRIQQLINGCSDPKGVGPRWWEPLSIEEFVSYLWVPYTDLRGLMLLSKKVLALVAPIPGFPCIEPLCYLEPDTKLQLHFMGLEDSPALYPVLTGVLPRDSAAFTLAILSPRDPTGDVYQDPVLRTILVGKVPLMESFILESNQKAGIKDGGVVPASLLRSRGITHYVVGEFPSPSIINQDGEGIVSRVVIRASAEICRTFYVRHQEGTGGKIAGIEKVESAAKDVQQGWVFVKRDGRCPSYSPYGQPFIYHHDMVPLEGFIPGTSISFHERVTAPINGLMRGV